jgi:hypothetical protein
MRRLINYKNIVMDIFSEVLVKRSVRKGVYAYKYSNGVIDINGSRYILYSLTDAIATWRRNNPIRFRNIKVSI